jgi:hypothetical protein
MIKINHLALAAATAILLLIVASIYVPWWTLVIGNPQLGIASFSPLNLNFQLLGITMTTPLIWALNTSTLLTLLLGSLVLLFYGVKPDKPYSPKLLSFGYKIPLYAVTLFIVEIVGLVAVAKMALGVDFPLMGSAAISFPSSIAPAGATGSIYVAAAFEWPFYLAIAVVVLCVAARFYHKKTVPATINH